MRHLQCVLRRANIDTPDIQKAAGAVCRNCSDAGCAISEPKRGRKSAAIIIAAGGGWK